MKMKKILSELSEIEKEYLLYFSEAEEHECYTKYTDTQLLSMYSHNCIVFRESLTLLDIHNQIKALFFSALETEAPYLCIVLPPNLSFAINTWEAEIFNASSQLYMTAALEQFTCSKGRSLTSNSSNSKSLNSKRSNSKASKESRGCSVIRATTSKALRDGECCDIVTSLSEDAVDYAFAYERASRRLSVFEENKLTIGQYIAYFNSIPVGKCDFSLHNKIIRPDSLAVMSDYQRKGIGTWMLEEIARDAEQCGAEQLFLLADANDSPKNMYKKLGFEAVGVETQLLWLNNS